VASRICQLFLDAGRAAYRQVGVVLDSGTVRAPDVTRFKDRVKPDLLRSQFPAMDIDLVVEVVSPESTRRDHNIKPLEYASAHIPGFWLVERDRADVYDAIVDIFQLMLRPGGNQYVLLRQVRLSDLEAEAGS
jgi:Uma2 family endonuclease